MRDESKRARAKARSARPASSEIAQIRDHRKDLDAIEADIDASFTAELADLRARNVPQIILDRHAQATDAGSLPTSLLTDDKVMLAFPAHKVTLNGNINLWRTLSLNTQLIGMSERWGYVSGDDMGNPVLGKLPASLLVNTYLLYRDLGWKGFDVGVGGFNVLGQSVPYLQPYNGGHAPLPGSSREIIGRVTYTLGFN